MAKAVTKKKLEKKNWVSNFNLIGEAKVNDYTYKIDEKSEKSDWVYNVLNLGVDCGDTAGTVYSELMGGYGSERDMRIAIESECDEKKYCALLKKRATLCCKTLDVVRHIIQRNIEKGLLPNYQDGAMEISKQYCTVGILGLYEVIEAFGYVNTDEYGYKSYSEDGIAFASKIFEIINEVKDSFTDEYSLNIESVPAERAAIILCQKDNLIYGRSDKFIYSNQWIPLSEKCSIQEKIRLSAILDRKCSGGSIAHINIEDNFPNTDTAWEMLNHIARSGVMYFAFNSKINECKNHHGFVGTKLCPICGEGVYDTYQRIVGYLVPTRSYSKDRFKEFNSRKWYEYADMSKDL